MGRETLAKSHEVISTVAPMVRVSRILQARDEEVDVYRFGGEALASRKREQLLCQTRTASQLECALRNAPAWQNARLDNKK